MFWSADLREAHARREARNAAAIANSGRQRTLVQLGAARADPCPLSLPRTRLTCSFIALGSKQAMTAAGVAVVQEKPKEAEMPPAQKVNMLLDEVKRRGEALLDRRDVDATKEMMNAVQTLIQKVRAYTCCRMGGQGMCIVPSAGGGPERSCRPR
jgi:hypothetical protein